MSGHNVDANIVKRYTFVCTKICMKAECVQIVVNKLTFACRNILEILTIFHLYCLQDNYDHIVLFCCSTDYS